MKTGFKKLNLVRSIIYFKIVKITKKDWENATCDNCNREFYPEEKEVYVWEGKYKGHLQLCSECVISEFLEKKV